jgi:hypothetical protein
MYAKGAKTPNQSARVCSGKLSPIFLCTGHKICPTKNGAMRKCLGVSRGTMIDWKTSNATSKTMINPPKMQVFCSKFVKTFPFLVLLAIGAR